MYNYNTPHECEVCHATLHGRRWGTKTCSSKCRQKAYRDRVAAQALLEQKARSKAARARKAAKATKKVATHRSRFANAFNAAKAAKAPLRKLPGKKRNAAKKARRAPPDPTAAPKNLCILHPKPKKAKSAPATTKTPALPGPKRR